jgi:hypothetical protein
VFFFEKKNQKTFAPLRALPASPAPSIKSFLLLFSKKKTFLTAYDSIPRAQEVHP